MNELITTIEEAPEVSAKISPMPDQPGDVPRTFADLERAQSRLDYSPQTSLLDGVRKYVETNLGRSPKTVATATAYPRFN